MPETDRMDCFTGRAVHIVIGYATLKRGPRGQKRLYG